MAITGARIKALLNEIDEEGWVKNAQQRDPKKFDHCCNEISAIASLAPDKSPGRGR
ncbi:MAG: hypothetical protein KGJ06_01835 [Pseudomonadota bacterium]|nr:hypothetical protein [Pseudomonadota bacterium]